MFIFIVPPVLAGAVVVPPPPSEVVVSCVVVLLVRPPPPHAARTSIPAPSTSATAESQIRRVTRSSGANPCHVLSVCLPRPLDLLWNNDEPRAQQLVAFTGSLRPAEDGRQVREDVFLLRAFHQSRRHHTSAVVDLGLGLGV